MADEGAAASRLLDPVGQWPAHILRFVDVGGAGGVQPEWLPYADRILPVMFEPNPQEATKLREELKKAFRSGLVLETGLSNMMGSRNLNLTRYWGCVSLRKPNPDILRKYRVGRLFEVVDAVAVECSRYDALYYKGMVPAPDAIKIDVQGFEYEVLQGFGGLLQHCLGIALEAHIYPIYKDQKLLHDLVGFLADFGFVLRRLSPVSNFDGDVVEVDAYFSKDIEAWRDLDPFGKAKFRLICDAWNLIDYSRIDPAAPHTQIAPAGGGVL